jgi:hypothetical protein
MKISSLFINDDKNNICERKSGEDGKVIEFGYFYNWYPHNRDRIPSVYWLFIILY